MKRIRLLTVALFVTLGLSDANAQAGCDEQLIVFGDSLSDTGNVYYLLSGETFPPSPPYADGRFTDGIGISEGLVWVEYLADLLEVDRPAARFSGEVHSTNYAFAGAVTGGLPAVYESTLTPGQIVTGGWPLDDQIAQFLDDLEASSASPGECGLNPAESLVIVWVGSNDILLLNEDKLGDAVANIRSNIETLIRTAGASQFLVANMPDVSLTPAYTAYDSYFIANDVVDIRPAKLRKRVTKFNRKLDKALDKIESKNPGVTIYRFDAFSTLNDIVAHPADYRVNPNTDIPLLDEQALFLFGQLAFNPGADRTSLFWDGVHPSSRVHAIFAEAACGVLGRCDWLRGAR